MALSAQSVAYGTVAVAGIVLFAIGTPSQRAREQAVNAPAPVARQAEAAAPSSVTVAGITLRSVAVEFPSSDRMFTGAGADVVNSNCTACHSPGMVLTQPRLAAAEWQAEVSKMRGIYRAPIATDDVAGIVTYLSNLQPGT